MIHELEKLAVIKAAREWAGAERRLREIAWYPNASENDKQTASRESDRTEAWLLDAVKKLEDREKNRDSMVLTFLGEPVEIGKPVTQNLYDYLKAQVPKGPSWWSIR
jgi:hypothetical protein